MDMHILILFLFLISFGRGQKLLDHEDFDSFEQSGVEASNFGRKTSSGGDVVLRISSSDDDDDDDDTAPSIEKNQSFSSFFFNLGHPGKNDMIQLTENNHNKESNSEESSRFSIRPSISGRSHSAELKNSRTSNEFPFEVTEVSVLTQISQADDSIELLTSELLKDSEILLTTSNEVSREANSEFRTNQSPEDQNSFETLEFIIKTVANGKVFATLLNNSDERTSAQASDEVSTDVNLRLLDSLTEEVTEASKPRGFFVRPEKNGRNFVTQLNNRRLDSNEDSFEVKVQTTQEAVKQSTFFVRPLISARNFAAELTSDKNNNLFHDSVEDSLELTVLRSDPVKKAPEAPVQPEFFIKPVINGRQFSLEKKTLEKKTNNLFHDSVEDSLEVTVLRSDPVNKAQETPVQPEFFIKPVINGRQFSTEKKNNNLFHDSGEDSLEVTVLRRDPVNKAQETPVQSEFFIKSVVNGRHFLPDKTTNNFENSFDVIREAVTSQSVETKTIPKAPQYIMHPVDNGGSFPISDEDSLEISETFIRSKVPGTTKSTPANFVTSFQQEPSVVQSSRNFKKSYPQRAITKFGVTQEVHQFSGYPSPKICLEGEVIGLDGRCTFPEIIKNIFIYQKPLKEDVSGELINPPKPKIKINLVVIRSNGNDNRGDPIIIPPPQEKTVVLVLDKEEENGGRKIIEVTPPPSGDPEVYFVDYKEGENPLLPGGINLQEALGAAIQETQQTYEVASQNHEQNYQSPQLQYGVPQQQYQSPQEQYQAPQLQYGPPQQHYQTLQKPFQAPQKEPEEQKPVVAQLFLEVDESSSSKEDFSFETQPRILLPSPTRLLNLKQNTDNARRSRAIGRGLPSWGRLRATENKRMRPIPVARSNK